jgi:hypothetical protein
MLDAYPEHDRQPVVSLTHVGIALQIFSDGIATPSPAGLAISRSRRAASAGPGWDDEARSATAAASRAARGGPALAAGRRGLPPLSFSRATPRHGAHGHCGTASEAPRGATQPLCNAQTARCRAVTLRTNSPLGLGMDPPRCRTPG